MSGGLRKSNCDGGNFGEDAEALIQGTEDLRGSSSLINGGRSFTAGSGSRFSCGRAAAALAVALCVGSVLVLLRVQNGKGANGELGEQDLLGLEAVEDEDPNWGCGLVGDLPGITQDGKTQPEIQRLIDGIKGSSTFNKVTFWNWNLAPQTEEKEEQHLSAEFIFMPEQWGAGPVEEKWLREAGEANFLDSNGKKCPAEMANIFLGMNEPDIKGSCMGNMFGTCEAPCTDAEADSGNCPVAYLDQTLPPAKPNSHGHCNCWQHSHATGVGYWPLEGCSAAQPLPHLWEDSECVDVVMESWKKTAKSAVKKGYKFLTTPLVAVDVGYAKRFIEAACGCVDGNCSCTDASCGCPAYVGFHFYAYDCQPERAGGYADFQKKLEAVASIMDTYPFVKGAIVNEVGMLNCAPQSKNPICVPNSGEYPAENVSHGGCPANDELPQGLATFIDKLFDYVIAAKAKDGRAVVKGFSWFNENMAGGTYNLRLFDEAGALNDAGEAYIRGCTRWAESRSVVPIDAIVE